MSNMSDLDALTKQLKESMTILDVNVKTPRNEDDDDIERFQPAPNPFQS